METSNLYKRENVQALPLYIGERRVKNTFDDVLDNICKEVVWYIKTRADVCEPLDLNNVRRIFQCAKNNISNGKI